MTSNVTHPAILGFYAAQINKGKLHEQEVLPDPKKDEPPSVTDEVPQEEPTPEEPVSTEPAMDDTASQEPVAPTEEEPVASLDDALPEDPAAGQLPPEASVDTQFTQYVREYAKMVAKYSDEPDTLKKMLQVPSLQNFEMTPWQRAFIDSNLSSVSLLHEGFVIEAQKQIKRISGSGGSNTSAFESLFDRIGELQDVFVRLSVAGPDRSNLLRQFMAAVLSGVVVPGPVGGEVMMAQKKSDEVVSIRPNCYTTWGYVDLGPVTIDGKSMEDYLSESERDKINDGAPEERRVLRNRLLIEAISDQLGGANYYIVVINPENGQWESVNFSSELFIDAYRNGNLTAAESSPIPTGTLCVDENGKFVNSVFWGIASIQADQGSLSDDTNEQTFPKKVIATIEGGRLIFKGDSSDLSSIGAEVGSHAWSNGDTDKLREVQNSIPDARAKLIGR